MQVGRSLALLGWAILFILATGRLPIADAPAMVFTSPLLMTLMSAWLRREQGTRYAARPQRWDPSAR